MKTILAVAAVLLAAGISHAALRRTERPIPAVSSPVLRVSPLSHGWGDVRVDYLGSDVKLPSLDPLLGVRHFVFQDPAWVSVQGHQYKNCSVLNNGTTSCSTSQATETCTAKDSTDRATCSALATNVFQGCSAVAGKDPQCSIFGSSQSTFCSSKGTQDQNCSAGLNATGQASCSIYDNEGSTGNKCSASGTFSNCSTGTFSSPKGSGDSGQCSVFAGGGSGKTANSCSVTESFGKKGSQCSTYGSGDRDHQVECSVEGYGSTNTATCSSLKSGAGIQTRQCSVTGYFSGPNDSSQFCSVFNGPNTSASGGSSGECSAYKDTASSTCSVFLNTNKNHFCSVTNGSDGQCTTFDNKHAKCSVMGNPGAEQHGKCSVQGRASDTYSGDNVRLCKGRTN
jgi:hypothetical protein